MRPLTRRAAVLGLTAAVTTPRLARAAWPDRPITLIHGFAPGGGADIAARLIAEPLARRLGQPVVVEAKPGAGSTLASALVARAAPDGHTLNMVGSAFAAAAAMYKKLPYRAVEDFTAIGTICEFPYLLVTYADHDIRNVADIAKLARTREAPLLYGTNGQGSTQHLLVELYARALSIKLQHVPFRGGAQALTELLGKRIDFMLDPPILFLDHIKNGKLRPLATTSIKRFDGLPEVPTIAESGVPDFDVSSWFGILGPAGTPDHVVSRLNAELSAAIGERSVHEKLKTLGNVPVNMNPAQFRGLIATTIAKWNKVIAEAQIERV